MGWEILPFRWAYPRVPPGVFWRLWNLSASSIVARSQAVISLEPGSRPWPGPGLGIGSLHALAGPFLRDIVELFAEDATLAIVDGTSVLFTEQVVGPNPIQVPDGTGMRYPLHTVASGYVFMSQWPDHEIMRIARNQGIEPDPIVDKVGSAKELGYAWHDGWLEGISAVAVPIRGDSGVVGTIGAFGPSYRFPGERSRPAVGEAIAGVASRLGQLLR